MRLFMAKNKNENRFGILFALIASFAIHGSLFFICSEFFSKSLPKTILNNQPIRISIKSKDKKKASETVRKNIEQPIEVAQHEKNDTKIINRYQDILPKTRGHQIQQELNVEGDRGLSEAGKVEFRYFDENEKLSAEERIKDTGDIQLFAKELLEHISIPFSLKEIMPAGQAKASFERKSKDDPWIAVSAYGDSYFRAVLYDALSSMNPQSYGIHLLSRTDFNTIQVYLTYRTKTSMDATRNPVSVAVNGRKIFLTFENAKDLDELMIFNVGEFNNPGKQSKIVPMINWLGVAMYSMKKATVHEIYNDPELRKLRSSPAFVRPIGK